MEDFDLSSFRDEAEVARYVDASGLRRLIESAQLRENSDGLEVIPPDMGDLCRLHWLCMTRRAVTVLEFGSGYSTLVLADAMKSLGELFHDEAARLFRQERPFHAYSVEEDRRFKAVTESRISQAHVDHVSVVHSDVLLIEHQGRYATCYLSLPNVAPSIIYLDGPSQYADSSAIRGFSIAAPTRMPMSCDILKIEHFLTPGTLILVDGRTANARFLRASLERGWVYEHDREGDVHLFELQEPPLGALNERQMSFSLPAGFLL